jgi:hypothetical protein
MAEYLPLRSYNRTQSVRIGGQKILPTVTKYVDVSIAANRKQLSYHSAIGAVYVVGDITGNNSAYAVHATTASATNSWYSTGTVTIASGAVTGSGTTFTNDMVGGILTSGSSRFLVSSFASTTSIGVTLISGSATVAAGASYVLAYNVASSATTSVSFIAGDIYDRVNEIHTYVPAQTTSAISAPATSLKSRRDLVSANVNTGKFTVTTGTDYTTIGGTPNTVTVPTGDVAIAYLTFRNGATTAQVTDLRQLA